MIFNNLGLAFFHLIELKLPKKKGPIPITNKQVLGRVDASVAKLAPCLKSDPIDSKNGPINANPRAS